MRSSGNLRRLALIRGAFLFLVIPLTSCLIGTHKQAAIPPPPQPVAVQEPAQNEPLSIPQTAVVLPSEQGLNPGALPQTPPAATTVPAPKPDEQPPSPQRATRHVPASQPKAEPEETAPQPAPPAPAVTDEKGPFQPILSPEERKRLRETVEARISEIEGLLARAKSQLSEHDQSIAERVKSFVSLAKDAASRGDYTQASDLTDRALILAKGLVE
jgi:hypothetical protein